MEHTRCCILVLKGAGTKLRVQMYNMTMRVHPSVCACFWEENNAPHAFAWTTVYI